MEIIYTILCTAYVTAVACFAFWATHQIRRRRYLEEFWDPDAPEEEGEA